MEFGKKIDKILEPIRRPFYPPIFRGVKTFLGNGLFEWTLLIIGVLIMVSYSLVGFLFTVFWVENFFFWLFPILIFQFYHWRAYSKKMTLKEYLEYKRLKKFVKKMSNG